MKQLDRFLNNITMYRLAVYALSLYAALGVAFALFGRLSASPTDMIVSLGLILGSAYVVDRGFSLLFKVPTNSESWLITGLILFLILKPENSLPTALALLLAGGVSSASKFIITWNNKHIFNPAAFAAALLSLTAIGSTTWWIGSSLFWPVTLVVGLAVVYKIRRFPLFLAFAVTGVGLQLAQFMHDSMPILPSMKGALLASPLIFLATIMLTEPATMPPRRTQQVLFGIGVAGLYVTAWQVGPLTVYPEVALLLGNIYAFVVSPKLRVRLQLLEVQRISDRVYNYVFRPDKRFTFLPGEYMDWTLAGVPYDSRGNRRTFTIASSPTEQTVQVGLKYYNPSSTYKATFASLKPGDYVHASQLAGNFTPDLQSNQKLALVAGGIGITPFRSVVKYLLDNNLQRDIVLLYVVSATEELAYKKEFLEAARIGLRCVAIVTGNGQTLDQAALRKYVPDYAERLFYISGPNRMVDATKAYLRALNVPLAQIRTDHFSGY